MNARHEHPLYEEPDLRAARYSDLFESGPAHAPDCAYCPICSAIGIVRRGNPEVLDHLATAARELLVAAGLLLEKAGEAIAAPEPAPAPERKLRRIDLD